MGDVNLTTQLVAFGNDGTSSEVWYESSSGTMTELGAANGVLPKEKNYAVIPLFMKVWIATSANYRYMDFAVTTPTWNTWTAASGSLPTNANIGCGYRGRVVLAGDTTAPHMWYMSRQGTGDCFTYGANDAQSAVAGADAEAGKCADIITSLIPYSDDYLVMGGAHTVHLLRGDPCAGGVIDLILGTDGIFGPLSYCFDGEGSLYFAGTSAIYKMQRGGSIPEPLTTTRLPDMFDTIDRDTHRIVMGYDARRQGILVCITKLSDGTGTHYWYDLRTDGFFPETYTASAGPYSLHYYKADADAYRHLVMGCKDGYLRRFDDTKKYDQLASTKAQISSDVLIGPVDLSQGDNQGKINKLTFTLGVSTAAVEAGYELYVENSAQELLDAVVSGVSPLHSGTISTGGRQYNILAKAKGAAMAVRLTNGAISTTYAIEKITGDANPAGRLKRV